MENFNLEKIIKINKWSKNLFIISSTRKSNFKFNNGEFVILGLNYNNKFISRAYSISSSNYEENLEFLSIKIEKGLFTSILSSLKINDEIFISKKSTGTIKINNLMPGACNLWMFSTGTGISPFISIIKDFNIYKNYKNIILVHSTKKKEDLIFKNYLSNIFNKNNFEFFNNFKFIYYPIVTKENFKNFERMTDSIKNNKIFYEIGLNKFDLNKDRIMICGNIEMIKDLKNIIEKEYNFLEYNNNNLGHFVTEKAFVS
ncbi:ferredoxin-NADP reductase [Candidatus Nasuia deltocephalinicola]|uniref:ferredoxin--NADP(+) reductase n=1 Tax=Candidatus Nasuia deltocephalincola TaxID=1160784 RepID=A0A974WKN2_9PROT|nr:ferredoxin--NADP(+) reductase [Candidatus Nasuia deltocephalinicola]WKD87099.1 ferredoxin--NADP reductase [Candidatus Nasuia deltocephalinicola]WKD87111.1 ferredoxin--NADP reductase [Candidatus Nasuia deltocephalinicola]BEH03838.1 ferredoxin-NADP reductase [Candidatus Nasuia deltocephalinicola]